MYGGLVKERGEMMSDSNNKDFLKNLLDFFKVAELQYKMYEQFLIITEDQEEAERQTRIFMKALFDSNAGKK